MVPFPVAISAQISAAVSPGGVGHGVALMKGTLDTKACARREIIPDWVWCKFWCKLCCVNYEDDAVSVRFEAAVGPEDGAENWAASCALGTGKTRWDGALGDAA